jgi:VanZ family protein
VKPRILRTWGPFLLALAGVFWLSSLPGVPGSRYVWDKLLHVVGYAGLGVLALRAFHGSLAPLRPKTTLLAGLVVGLWGMSDEYHQSFVPGRDASAWDVVADAVGFLVAVAIAMARAKHRRV